MTVAFPLKTLICRLTSPARRALEEAASRALARTHHEIEIEHVLLALLDQNDNALVAALRAGGTDMPALEEGLRRTVDGFRTGNPRNPVLSTWLPKWLEHAWLVAGAQHREEHISTLDLLLALLTDDALGRATQASAPQLHTLDPSPLDAAYEALRRHGGEGSPPGIDAAPANGLRSNAGLAPQDSHRTPALDRYTVDLTALARSGGVDPVLGRDVEIRQMTDILLRRRQNNPILTGEPGVGKTAVVEGLALKIVRGDVPPALREVVIRSLDLGQLQAGAGVKGEFEGRLRQVIDEVKCSPRPVILFIDEAHTMIGAGAAAGQNDAANLLKPALARGELRTIAATTWAEYKKYFEKDAALARRFQMVKIEEPTPETAVQMVRGIAEAMARHHKIDILDEAVAAAVHLSSRYVAGRQLPDKAIGVLDTACARVALARAGRPGPLEDLEALIANIDREQAALAREEGHAERIGDLVQRRAALEADLISLRHAWDAQRRVVAEIDVLRSTAATPAAKRSKSKKQTPLQTKRAELRALQGSLPLAFECVDASVIADVISGWTGIPLGRMVHNELQHVRNLAQLLGERVIGQDHALQQIAERVQIAKAGLDDPGKPKGVFLLAGPSGVGKTETAIALAETLYGGERNLITINMSEYQEAHTVSGLKGAPPGYVGYGEGGVLTEAVRRKPYSVVLLDEVEKAHPDVLELFFQVFDKGILEDGEGREVDFRNTIILLTSNTGTDLVMRAVEHGVTPADGGPSRIPTPEDLVALLRPTLQKVFKPAFLGRLSIVPYYPLSDAVLHQIVALKLDKIKRRIQANHGAAVEFDGELVDLIAGCCYDLDSGARDADAVITRTVLARISADLLARISDGKVLKRIAVGTKGGDLVVKLT